MKSATNLQDWQKYYSGRKDSQIKGLSDLSDFLNLPKRLIISEIGECIVSIRQKGMEPNLIEIGAGDSAILIDIAKRYRLKNVWGLDILPEAVSELRKKAEQTGVPLQTVCADLFSPPKSLLKRFDVVYSLGVVEHFDDLAGAVRAVGRFVRPGGLILTLIPNLKDSLLYAPLMRIFNEEVYRAHFLYGKDDLFSAHKRSGFLVRKCEYFVSSNLSLLSWCFADRRQGLSFWFYKQLTRVSKAIWYFEDRYGCLRPTKWFSPYIVCVAEKPK